MANEAPRIKARLVFNKLSTFSVWVRTLGLGQLSYVLIILKSRFYKLIIASMSLLGLKEATPIGTYDYQLAIHIG